MPLSDREPVCTASAISMLRVFKEKIRGSIYQKLCAYARAYIRNGRLKNKLTA